MCKDSLDAIPTRLATEAQKLVTHIFPEGATGFVSAEDAKQDCMSRRRLPKNGSLRRILRKLLHIFHRTEPVSAIYVPFGTRFILKDIPVHIQETYGVQCEEGAIFVLMNGDVNPCRDGVRFANGREIHLRDLPEVTPFEVLSLAGTEFALYEQDLEMHALSV